MANEITLSTNLQLTNGGTKAGRNVSKRISQSTARHSGNVQNIGTTQEAVVVASDIATPGFASFVNLDATNYLEIGLVVSATFYPLAKLEPGEPAVFRLATGTFYAKANTAACDLEVLILAD